MRPIGQAMLALGLIAALAPGAFGQRHHSGHGGGSFGGGASGGGVAGSPGFSQNDIHDPFSPRYNALLPGNTGRAGVSFYNGLTVGNGAWFGGGTGLWYGGFAPAFYPPFGYRYGFGPYGFGYGFYPPPIFVPAEVNYGPQAVKRFMGIADDQFAPAVAAPVAQPVGGAAVAGAPAQPVGGFGVLADPVEQEKPRVAKPSSAEARARSQRQTTTGDAAFARQSYSSAYQNYRSAAQVATDLPEPHWRQGFALFALGRFDAAAKSFKRGLDLDPDWATSGFRLQTLYGDNQIAKATQIETLAQAVAKSQSADLLFVLGVVLYFDGEPERSRPFFLRSRDLNIGNDAHLVGFLKALEPQAEQAAAPVAAPAAIPVAKPAPRVVVPLRDPQPATKRPDRAGSVDL